MAASIRRNTYILENSGQNLASLGPTTGIDRQNIMRLKVNRIALVQELRVEHITGLLMEAGVIAAKDLKKIESGRTSQDKARILVDLLPTKSKNTEWYKHFREALQNPEASPETKKRYKNLVDFLDNTVIHRPTSQAGRFRDMKPQAIPVRSLPPINGVENDVHPDVQRYSPLPNIDSRQSKDETNCELNTAKSTPGVEDVLALQKHRNMTLVKGYFHQWLPTPENYKSVLDLPESHREKLASSENPQDHKLLEKEETALNYLRRVEVITVLAQRKQLPMGFEMCLCDAVQDILNQPETHHLYMKHLVTMEASEIMLVKDLISSYESVLQLLDKEENKHHQHSVVQTGLKMANFLITINKYPEADGILVSTLQFLKQSTHLDFWVARYQAYVKLMQTRNLSYQLDKAQNAYFDAVQMQYQIKLMSFGQPVLHEGSMHAETSQMLLEYGSIISAHGWARKALKEVDPDDPVSVVRVLCVAINSYCAQWLVKRAELLAIYVVQYAREKFGERHPMYIEALLHFCHFNTEFKQDELGIKIAKASNLTIELLDVAERTYGCESIHVALAHRAISRSLMCMHKLDTEDYYTHAIEAVRIARSLLGQSGKQLHIFLDTLASALQWKALHCPKELHDSTLHWAEAEAKQGLALVTNTYGEISLKSAQMLLLLGHIYSKMNKLVLSERLLCQAVDYLKLCQPPSSNYLLLGMANLGTFYKILLKPDLAIPRLKYVVEHAESTGWYIKWVHMCFDSLAALYNSIGDDKEADLVQVRLSQWLKANPIKSESIDYSQLQQVPVPFTSFLAKADIWVTTVQKVMALPSEKAFVAMGENDSELTDNCIDDEMNNDKEEI
ncbi:unnamed protein product [Lymnaea stagnalis]|uniref:CARD domain-containing protein n=1 Tax=Lymnaea stagnalis TaxID=6523 RepID=A0AAV2IE86_LYMST